MAFRSHALVLAVTLTAAAVFAADDGKLCSASARQCELEIRQMLAGRRYLGATVVDSNPGVTVKSVASDGPAAHAGLREGDRIIAANGRSLLYGSAREFKQTQAEAKDSGNLSVIVQRRSAYKKVDIRLEPFPRAQIDKIVAAHLAQSHLMASGAGAQP